MFAVGFALSSIILFNPNAYSTELCVLIMRFFIGRTTSIADIRKIAATVKINFRVETTDWMVYSLLFNSLFQSFAAQLSYSWLYRDITSPDYTRLCYLQGASLAVFDLAFAFFAGLMCFFTMSQLFKLSVLESFKIGSWMKVCIFCFCYAVPVILTFSIHLFQTDPSLPVFVDVGNHGKKLSDP